jgi:hypothetical protein
VSAGGTARPRPLDRARAEAVAAAALAFIAEDRDRLGRFLALSGLSPDELRRRLAEPAFLGGVLDFLLGDEALLVAFAQHQGIAPNLPAIARRLLP